MSVLLALLGSSGFGSILGGLFAWLNRKNELEAKRMDLAQEQAKWAHDQAMRAADLEMVKAEAAGRKDVAIVEGEASVEAARMAALSAAYASDKLDAEEVKAAGWWSWALVLADAYRRFIRPGATTALLAGALYIEYLVIERWLASDWSALPVDMRFQAGQAAVAWVTCQAAASLNYWFVSRGSSK